MIYERTCIVCRTKHHKRDLIRIAKKDNRISVDADQIAEGRGSYVCRNAECAERACKTKALNRVFRTQVSDDVYEALREVARDERSGS